MIAELIAALGDEFAYIQDRFAREGYLETLAQRRSLAALRAAGRLPARRGRSARHTWLDSPSTPGAAGSAGRHCARGRDPRATRRPFEIGPGLRIRHPAEGLEQARYWLHALWNDMPAHVPDAGRALPAVGARELVPGRRAAVCSAAPPARPTRRRVAGFWIDGAIC